MTNFNKFIKSIIMQHRINQIVINSEYIFFSKLRSNCSILNNLVFVNILQNVIDAVVVLLPFYSLTCTCEPWMRNKKKIGAYKLHT